MSYGSKVKAARKMAGLTQAQLAEKCNMATITIQQYERGVREPRFEQLKRIAKALDVSVLHLLGLEEVDDMQLWRQNPHDPKIEALRQYAKENGVSEACIMGIDETVKETAQEALRVISARSQNRIAEALKQLNAKGQLVAAERIEELTKIPDYQRTKTPDEK